MPEHAHLRIGPGLVVAPAVSTQTEPTAGPPASASVAGFAGDHLPSSDVTRSVGPLLLVDSAVTRYQTVSDAHGRTDLVVRSNTPACPGSTRYCSLAAAAATTDRGSSRARLGTRPAPDSERGRREPRRRPRHARHAGFDDGTLRAWPFPPSVTIDSGAPGLRCTYTPEVTQESARPIATARSVAPDAWP